MSALSPSVSIVVPCRNEARHIESCLRDVLAFEPPRGDFEVIVADGMSDDGTRGVVARIVESDPRVRLVDNPHGSTPHGLSVGDTVEISGATIGTVGIIAAGTVGATESSNTVNLTVSFKLGSAHTVSPRRA